MNNIQEAIENKIIDSINLKAGGRLVTFKPPQKGFEDYLVVERRGEYKKKENEIYLQVNALVGPTGRDLFEKDFEKDAFRAEKNYYSIFIYFNEIAQKASDYVWFVPSAKFLEIADVFKSKNGKKIVKFEASLDVSQKNIYSKYIVKTDDLGKIILEIFEKGGKIDFKEKPIGFPFEEKIAVNLESLNEFLNSARENTFASGAASVDNPRLLGSKQLEFQKGDYFYQDIFFAGQKGFVGQEIIYQNLNPVWGMNYFGNALGKIEEEFLKEALSELSDKCRQGNECSYEKRGLKYYNKGQGGLGKFFGEEEIFSDKKSIYKLNYQGGLL